MYIYIYQVCIYIYISQVYIERVLAVVCFRGDTPRGSVYCLQPTNPLSTAAPTSRKRMLVGCDSRTYKCIVGEVWLLPPWRHSVANERSSRNYPGEKKIACTLFLGKVTNTLDVASLLDTPTRYVTVWRQACHLCTSGSTYTPEPWAFDTGLDLSRL